MSVTAATNWLRPFGTTGITASAICMGGAQLGSMPELFGYEVTEDAAIDLVRQVMDSPIRFLDTSNGYGGGRSEERIGRAIAAARRPAGRLRHLDQGRRPRRRLLR